MRHTIIAPFKRVMRLETESAAPDVHFHLDGHGGPFVCDHHRCESPRLTAHELGLGR